jgi:2-oxoglutarate ferredoxin oxidoreductase subunit alpha
MHRPATWLENRATVQTRQLMRGNEAIAEAAIRAGCGCFFAYPITPASEILEYMAVHMPEAGRVFLQPESELASINMAFGAACAGKRVMVSSSSPGVSLMQEGISTLAAAQLPCVIVNIMRGGPGLGTIPPSQADYFQATKGGGHGDYHSIVVAPASVQEMADLTVLAFDLADQYRNPAVMLADGILGQMMEPVVLPEIASPMGEKSWVTNGAAGRKRNLLLAAPENTAALMALNRDLAAKYATIASKEQRWQARYTEDARIVVVAFGTAARVALKAVEGARSDGLPVGLIRPITLWPFPHLAFRELRAEGVLTVEMNNGQMVEDVRLAINGRVPVRSYGFGGGWFPDDESVREAIDRLWSELHL